MVICGILDGCTMNKRIILSAIFVIIVNLLAAGNAGAQSWTTETVDSAGFVGYNTSIALDSSGKAYIIYSDFTNGDLKYATNATSSSAPTVTTSLATGVTTSSATLNGTVTANGLSTTAWFEYGASSGSYTGTTTSQSVSGTSTTSVSIGISGLSASTTYYYRIAAENSAGTSYGSENSFSTTVTADLNTLTASEIAQSLLGGIGISSISNVTYTGSNVAAGNFGNGHENGIGIENGVILSTGNIADFVGPNDSDEETTSNGTSGDTDLNSLTGMPTYDATVLEFDFVPTEGNLNFQFIFASEEYNEYVNSGFNDAFGFYVDGVNIALIPNTTEPISIDTVNLTSNSTYYINNDLSDLGTPTPFNTQYDGFTTVLTAKATVTSGNTHHMKVAIADTFDSIYDSAVFISAESFSSTNLATVTTGDATNVTLVSATLNGTVNADSTTTTAWFEYGASSGSYTGTTTSQSVSGTSTTSVSASISGLSASTTYYYRIAAQNSVGTFYGSEASFITTMPPGSISGEVLDASGQPVAGVGVSAFDFVTWDWINWGITDAAGNYTILQLPAGGYSVYVDTSGTSFAAQYYNNATWDTATRVDVIAGADTPDINFVLQVGGSISGKVLDASDLPVAGVGVSAFDSVTWDWINWGITDAAGNYTILQLPTGGYKVFVSTFGTSFVEEWYNDKISFESATVINVTATQNATDINFVLSKGNSIKGKVTANDVGVPDLFVSAFDSNSATQAWINGATTNSNGDYSITVLPGTYKVVVETFGTSFLSASQDNVSVVAGSDTLNINFALSTGKSIKGKVTGDGNPLSDMFVIVLKSTTFEFVNYGMTDEAGDYAIPVPNGTYRVEVETFGTNFVGASQDNVVVAGADITVNFSLSPGNSIKGRVTNSSLAPLQDMFVLAYDFTNGFWINWGVTDENGDYSITVAPGGYKVQVDAFGTSFAPEFYNDKGWDNANQVEVVAGQDTLNIDFTLVTASLITGNITDGTNPVPDVFVDVFDSDGFWVNFGQSDASGTYTVGVAPGTYMVGTFALYQGFADQFFNGKSSLETADPVTVPQEGVSGINFELTRGGSISGDVAPDTAGLEIQALEFNTGIFVSNGITAANGNYTITGLPAGNYRVFANDPAGAFPSQYYNGVTSWALATSVATTNGGTTTAINFTLTAGGSISGAVTAPGAGTITVEAYEFNTGLWINSDDVTAGGNYKIPLANGNYRLRAFDPGGTVTAEYFDNVTSWNEAASVNVASDMDTPDKDFTLSQGSSISGGVKDDKNKLMKGIEINVFAFNTDAWINGADTDENGKYNIPVAAGKYRVMAIPSDPTFTTVFYQKEKGNVSSWNEASPVSVSDGNSATNINFKLSKGGTISGNVKDSTNNNLSKINVQVFDFDKDSWVNDATTDLSGDYSIAVPFGKYRVWALPMDAASNVSSEFFDDKTTWDQATAVDVSASANATNINFALSTGKEISGNVTDSSSPPNPISGATIDIFDFDAGDWIKSAVSDTSGAYAIQGVLDGDYRAQASPSEGTTTVFAASFFENASNWDGAKRLTVAGADRTNINFTLSSGGKIEGGISNETTGSPISGVEVNAFDFDTGVWVNNGVTDGTGNYAIQVPAGIYMVRTTAKATGFADEFFDNTTEVTKAKPVTVTTTIDAKANFKLTDAGKITGVVKDSNGAAIQGSQVNAFDFNTNAWTGQASTDSNGAFFINLPGVTTTATNYRLQIKGPAGSDFIEEFYNNTTDFNQATPVSVTVPNTTTLSSDINLAEGRGFITGQVTGTGTVSGPLEGIKIKIVEAGTSSANLERASGFTSTNGNYTISLAPGSYLLRTASEGTTTAYVEQFFNNVTTIGSATAVTVLTGVTQTANFVLNTGKFIKGRVKSAADSVPLAGVEVHAFKFNTTTKEATWTRSNKTDSSGNYKIIVPDDTYRVFASSNNVTLGIITSFKSQFFDKKDNIDQAGNVIVSGTDTPNVDFDLTSN